MECLDEQTVLDLVGDSVADERRAQIMAHADGCTNCRTLIAAASRAFLSDDKSAAPDAHADTYAEPNKSSRAARAELPPGRTLGRYSILEFIGEGGMGVVCAAYDPELDRRVALKLVRTRGGPDETTLRARLQREARALARLSHPNVVTVHDVGTVDDQLFIAMEFVDGPTLARWLKEHPSASWQEKLSLLLQAGRGLAAAHAMGLVHRDFKPDNVLIGKDGRARVTDFGLVRADALDDAVGMVSPSATETDDDALTRTGLFVGTPAYTAPEQMSGKSVDARADVFSFCVTAYECLYGVRPFRAATLGELREAIRDARIVDVRDGGVPHRIRRLLVRGLAADPEQRFASLTALLPELQRGPLVRRRRRVAAALLLALVAVAVWAIRARDRGPQCGGGAERMASVWSAARKNMLGITVGAADPPAWQRVASALDDYARRWVASHQEVCLATRVRGEQSEATFDLRMECLDERRRELDAFVTALGSAPDALHRSQRAVHNLAPIGRCDDVAQLRARPQSSVAPALFADLRAHAERVEALARFDSPLAATEADAVIARARDAGAIAICGEMLHVRANLDIGEDRFERGEQLLYESVAACGAAGDDYGLAGSLADLIELEASQLAHFDDARHLVAYAQKVVGRLSHSETAAERLLQAEAVLASATGQPAAAEVLERRALTVVANEDPDELELAVTLESLASVVGDQGKFEEALQLNQRALDLFRKLLGPDDSAISDIQNQIIMVDYYAGRVDQAVTLQRAMLDHYRSINPRSTDTASAYTNLGAFLMYQRPAEAVPLLDHAIALREAVHAGIDLVYPLTAKAVAELALGKPELARPLAERALQLQSAPELADSPDRAKTELALARALGGGERALALARHARDVLAKSPLGVRRTEDVTLAEAFIAAHEKR